MDLWTEKSFNFSVMMKARLNANNISSSTDLTLQKPMDFKIPAKVGLVQQGLIKIDNSFLSGFYFFPKQLELLNTSVIIFS